MHVVTESKTTTLWLLGVVAAGVIFLAFSGLDDTKPEIAIPVNLSGRTAANVDEQLRDLGFANIMYTTSTGTSATVRPEWTVVSVDGAGQSVGLDAWITVRVR
jgi:hypothetical protein